ncbi:uncharacterized protein LOC125490097 [Plutella xylostella]|uniref:uncharacterized protein LOC125490097 n=1 Tax=Plutella xylostella TaxID=51655 RepID=UPI0020325C89|nr:uncharacterized protein LOC125490097 [Plutella xylostella]
MGKKRKIRDAENDRIAKKIKLLENKLRRERRIISSDDSDSHGEEQVLPDLTPSSSPGTSPRSNIRMSLDMPSLLSPMQNTSPSEQPNPEPTTADVTVHEPGLPSDPGPSTTTGAPNEESEAQLEEDILQILGEAPQPDIVLGRNIHRDIASRWQDILLKGMTKESKEQLFKKYLIPANCHYLVAPILNPEAKAAVPDILAKRDCTLLQKQNQIGVALAALSQVIEMIVKKETATQLLLQPLSDACRLLCDSHNMETKTRRSIVMSTINTSLRETLTNSSRDKYLFGEDLTEKLKAAKSVQRTGESLLKPNPVATSSKNSNYKNLALPRNRNLNYRGQTQKRPPNRQGESSRGRPPARQQRATPYARPPPPPPKAPSPTRRPYRR